MTSIFNPENTTKIEVNNPYYQKDKMINQQDLKSLLYYQSRKGKIFRMAIGITSVLMFLLAASNLYQIIIIGKMQKYDLFAIFGSWIKGVNLYGIYSGIYVIALQHLNNIFLDLIIGLFLLVLLFWYNRLTKRDAKIYQLIKTSTIQEGDNESR